MIRAVLICLGPMGKQAEEEEEGGEKKATPLLHINVS